MKRSVLLFLLLLLARPALAADELGGWRIVQLSAADRLLVARSPEGELRLLRAGDRLGPASVVGFDGDRVELDRPGEWGRVRLFLRVGADGVSDVERLERQPLRQANVDGERAGIAVRPTGER